MSVHSSGPTDLRLRPVLLRCSNSLGTTASFLSLSKELGFTTSQLGLANRLLYFTVVSHILTTPYILSLVGYCHIPLPPPKALKGVRGIYPFQLLFNTERRAGYICVCA
jgi:hypothetical protein